MAPVVLFRLKLLGGFEARRVDGSAIGISAKKSCALLAYLALTGGRTHQRGKLADLLWSDRGDKQARDSLRQRWQSCVTRLPTFTPQRNASTSTAASDTRSWSAGSASLSSPAVGVVQRVSPEPLLPTEQAARRGSRSSSKSHPQTLRLLPPTSATKSANSGRSPHPVSSKGTRAQCHNQYQCARRFHQTAVDPAYITATRASSFR
jgi:hypothetical protein